MSVLVREAILEATAMKTETSAQMVKIEHYVMMMQYNFITLDYANLNHRSLL